MAVENVIGILGAGRIGRLHAENIVHFLPNVKIKYIVDTYLTPEIKSWANSIGVTNVNKDPNVIFNDTEIDSIFICSPTPTHCDFILKACDTKKNVFCEKPLDSDLSRIYKAMDAINKSRIKFLMGFMRRFDVNHKKIHDSIAAGSIGKPEIIKICSRDPGLPSFEYIASSGGLFFDMMIHDFDLARYFSLSEVEEVYAKGAVLVDSRMTNYGDVDTAIVTLQFKNGALGVIDDSRRTTYGYDQRMEVHGEKGCIQVSNIISSTVTLNNEKGVLYDKPVNFFLERYNNAFIEEEKTFFEVVNKDKPAPVTVVDGLQSILIAMAAKKSFIENRPVKISEIQ